MPLIFEIHTENRGWVEAGRRMPGEAPASVSHNPPEGGRDIYLAESCEYRSTIYRSIGGIDSETPSRRLRQITSEGVEIIAVLKDGESHEMALKTDRLPEPQRVRFRHVDAAGTPGKASVK